MKADQPSKGMKPRRQAGKKMPGDIPQGPDKKSEISIGGNVTGSTIISGNENKVNIYTSNEQERKIASDLLKINQMLEKGQTRQAREKLAELEALRVDFPGLESAAKRLQTVARRQGYVRLMYVVAAVVFLFLFGTYLITWNKQMLCETGEGYYLKGILAVAEQEVAGNESRLWIGTSNNTNKKEVLIVQNENEEKERTYDKEELKSDSITAIVHDEGRNGTWVGTGGGGLLFIDSSLNIQRRFTLKDGIPGCKITDVVLTQEGIYVTAIAGTGMSFSADGVKWDDIPIPQDYQRKKQFDIFDAASDSDGSIWIGTHQDVYQRIDGNWKHYQLSPEKTVTVQAIAVGNDSIKWVGTINGLILLDTKAGSDRSKSFYTIEDGLPSDYITDIAIQDENTTIVGTTNGVVSCERNGGGLEIECYKDEKFKDLGKITTIAISLDGTLVYLGGEANKLIIR